MPRFNSVITLMLLTWLIILKKTQSTICSCENVCQIMTKFDTSLKTVEKTVENRTYLIKNLKDIEEKLQKLENNDQVLRRGKDLSIKKISEEVKNLKTKTEMLEKTLRYVVSFLGSKDEKEVETLKTKVKEDEVVDKDFKKLFSKVKVVAKRAEVKILDERLHHLEDRVSKCEERHLELASNTTKARKKMDETLTGKSRLWEKRLQSLESKCKAKLDDLKEMPEQLEVLYNESMKQRSRERTLQKKLKKVQGKLENMGTRVLSNMTKESLKILEDFKEEWSLNCSKGIAPCYFIDISRQPSYVGNRTWNRIDEAESFENPEDFWGCKPLRLGNYPQVSTMRDEARKTIWFRCKDGHQFLGIDFMKCIQNGIWVGREEPPECPGK